MNTAISLKGLNQEVDPNKIIERLQNFFNEVHSITVWNAEKLLAIYSTADMLGSMGLPEASVKVIKNAAYARAKGLYEQSPYMMKEVWASMLELEKRK